MAKLVKQCRYNKKGEAVINCYHANISKEVAKKADINEDDEIVVRAKKGKIIIQKK